VYEKIKLLRKEAGQTGDLLQVAVCDLAVGKNPTQYAAVEFAESYGLCLCKYNDPIEEQRSNLTVGEANEVAKEDPGLIYLDTAEAEAHGFSGAWALELCEEALRD